MTFSKYDLEPAYAMADAAFILRLAGGKVERWAAALDAVQQIRVGQQQYRSLSYASLLELHVLKAMRIKHGVPFQRIRKAIDYLRNTMPTPYPLLDHSFGTNGLDLFFEHDGDLLNASRAGQQAIRELVNVFQSRIEWQVDANSSFFPFVQSQTENEPKLIEMKPTVAFGRPVLTGTGITAEIVAGRFFGRDTAADLAAEYMVPIAAIEEAIRWEMPRFDAA